MKRKCEVGVFLIIIDVHILLEDLKYDIFPNIQLLYQKSKRKRKFKNICNKNLKKLIVLKLIEVIQFL